MPILTPVQVAAYAYKAGIHDANTIADATTIAFLESGNDTTSHNPKPPDDSYGLWQINMLGQMGPDRRKQFGLSDNNQLYDPAVNARAMFALSNSGKNWSPWTTYTRYHGTARYTAYYNLSAHPSALIAVQTKGAGAVGTGIPVPSDVTATSENLRSALGIGKIGSFFEQLGERDTWMRVAKVGIGAALIIVAMIILVPAATTVDVIKPVGKLVKGVKSAKSPV